MYITYQYCKSFYASQSSGGGGRSFLSEGSSLQQINSYLITVSTWRLKTLTTFFFLSVWVESSAAGEGLLQGLPLRKQ